MKTEIFAQGYPMHPYNVEKQLEFDFTGGDDGERLSGCSDDASRTEREG